MISNSQRQGILKQSGFFLLAMVRLKLTQITHSGITCSQNAGSVNIYKHFNMFDNDETFAPTAQPSAQPSTNPTPAPTQTPTYPPTEAPTFPPTAAPTHSPPLTCDTICLVGIGAGVLAISIVVLLCIRRKTKKVTPQTALQKPK
eukprot:CAMPEP_0203788302 /NCGR_PEP_ID=MMETSP0100_2-20121128/2761_1 /ASSEMBLY_ACC=CAM_ASM_000210 /TAXON_ID=96639 /ORGANISM=" , Strain NY0313808BC1" /LENGTH=144 /DNA_ID=CAMNT_0050691009 /DNA_START=103 /DNA_END=537 /DNA_ORIENTATION=+